MRDLIRIPGIALLMAGSLTAQDPLERRLPNGVRIVIVERPASRMVHAVLVAEHRSQDGGGAPLAAFDMIRRCLAQPAEACELQPGEGFETAMVREDRLRRSLWDARRRGRDAQAEALQALHLQAVEARRREQIQGKGPGLPGAAWSHVDGDLLAWGTDLAPETVGTWAKGLGSRLEHCGLGGFPGLQESWLKAMDAGLPAGQPWPALRHAVLPTLLGGSAYAPMAALRREDVEGLSWPLVRRLAQTVLAPERLSLVLVGPPGLGAQMGALEQGLGGLKEGPAPDAWVWETGEPARALWGAQRIQASLDLPARLVAGLRLPPSSAPEWSLLPLLGELVAGDAQSMLGQRLLPTGRAKSMTLELGVPGSRQGGIALVEFEPGAGVSLAELETELEAGLVKIQREGLRLEAVEAARARLAEKRRLLREEPVALGRALAFSLVRQGDWREALEVPEPDFEALQGLVRRLLAPGQISIVRVDRDALLHPRDEEEARLIACLTRLVARNLLEPAARDQVVRDTVQQVRQLPAADRAKLIARLEAQL